MKSAIMAGLLLLLTGCGAVVATVAIVDADGALEHARAADASKWCAYEFTAADAYLNKAREEASYADYEIAIDYAHRAAKLARTAAKKARERRQQGGGKGAAPAIRSPRRKGS